MELVDAMTVGALTETGRERETEREVERERGVLPSASEHQRKELSERYQVSPGGASGRNTISISSRKKVCIEIILFTKLAAYIQSHPSGSESQRGREGSQRGGIVHSANSSNK